MVFIGNPKKSSPGFRQIAQRNRACFIYAPIKIAPSRRAAQFSAPCRDENWLFGWELAGLKPEMQRKIEM